MHRKNESCYQIMIATLKMAGVAGFEPTNDGVRGSMGEGNLAIFAPGKIVKKLPFWAGKQAKTY